MSAELILLLGLMLLVGGLGLVWIASRSTGGLQEARRVRAATILQDPSGRYIYFPWGRFGQGYLLPDREAAERIQRFRGRYMIGILLLVPILWPLAETAGSAASLVLVVGLVAIYGLGYIAFVRWTVHDLPTSQNTYHEIRIMKDS